MATAYGNAHVILGQSPPTITMYGKTGTDLGAAYVNPAMDEASVTVGFTHTEVVGTSGEVSLIRSKGEYLEATFQLRPCDTNGDGTSTTDALLSARLPGAGFSFRVTGMKAFAAGSFTNALNYVESTQTQPWFVQPGATLRGPSQDVATITLTARRYLGITSHTPVTE